MANANEEIEGISKINLRHEAVADKKFQETLGESAAQSNVSMVTLKTYEPNELTYEVNSDKGGIVVFSEVYYPGWTATIDGQKAELGRVDYILRALNVKVGKHNVVLTFKPQSIKNTETIAYVSYAILILAIIAIIYMNVRRKEK